ncbi:proteophosphoglycan 5 [Diplodia corticola]|uniref:Proteophosphoglycan 5 n=1 Tax=Diplodia corticola TaxID=236234 RepID=A0A1J9RVZ8_9PEZI|nr:proteophosphoglycan 5 [Diplodia corticola]OJD32551.1 proteophosphoglycan 5 [Diplodia corticola]
MSDDEADTIVVAMAAPNGPLGDSFEVDVAAGSVRPNSPAKLPRKRRTPAARRTPLVPAPSVRPKRNTTRNSRSGSSVDSAPYSHSPSPSVASTNSAASTATSSPINRNSSIANAAAIAAAQNTRLVRMKKQLCTQWGIQVTDLNVTFNSTNVANGPPSPSPLSAEPSVEQLARMAELTDASFTQAMVALKRAKVQRLTGGSEAPSGAGEGRGDSDDEMVSWIPDDVDRATDLIMAEAKAGAGDSVSKKRTAIQAGAHEERPRPAPAEREMEVGIQKRAGAQKGRPPPVEVRNELAGNRPQGLPTPTDEMDTRSERASVPRASSIEAMSEARHDAPQVKPIPSMQPQSQLQPAVVIGPALEPATTPSQAPSETPCLQPHAKVVTGPVLVQSSLPPAQTTRPQPQAQGHVLNGSPQEQPTPSQIEPTLSESHLQPHRQTEETKGVVPVQLTPLQGQASQLKTSNETIQTQSTLSQTHKTKRQNQSDPSTGLVAEAAQSHSVPSQVQPAQSHSQSGRGTEETTPAARTDAATSRPNPQTESVSETTRPKSTPSQTPSQPPPVEQITLSQALREAEPPCGVGVRQTPEPWSTRKRKELSTLTHPYIAQTSVFPVRPSTASPTLPRPQALPQPASNSTAPNSPISGGAVTSRRMSYDPVWIGIVPNGVASSSTGSSGYEPNSPKTNCQRANAPQMSVPMPNSAMPTAPMSIVNTTMMNAGAPSLGASNSLVQKSPVSNASACNANLQSAAINGTASGNIPNDTTSGEFNDSAQRPVGLVEAGGQNAGSYQHKGEATHAQSLAGTHLEALGRLENDQTLPPPVFDYILQCFSSLSASHVTVSPVTTIARTSSRSSFMLLQYSTIMVPFYMENSWTLASLNLESKAMTICGPQTEHTRTESAAISFFATSLDDTDHKTWKKTYISLGPPPNYWDQPIVCLVAAIHMFCGLNLLDQNPDPTVWRNVLVILLKGLTPGSPSIPRPTHKHDSDPFAAKDQDVDPAKFAVPPPPCPLYIKNYLAHINKALAAFRVRYHDRLTEARGLASHGAHARTLFSRLLEPAFLAEQNRAYETRLAEMRGLVDQTEDMMETLSRLKAPCSMGELKDCVEGAKRVETADAARMERLEWVTGKRDWVGGMVGDVADEAEGRAKKLEESWGDLWGTLDGEFGRLGALLGPHRSGAGGSGGGGGEKE